MRISNAIDIVREGYEKLAATGQYRTTRPETLITCHEFSRFLEGVRSCKKQSDGKHHVIELGCATGHPVGAYLSHIPDIAYKGFDVSPSQIKVAKKEFSNVGDCFFVGELLDTLKTTESESVDGILMLYTLFHLPRTLHAQVLSEAHRVLCPGGQLLFTIGSDNGEGVNCDWMGTKMYWSQFSPAWYELTVADLLFDVLLKSLQREEFLGETEETFWMLLEKDPHKPESFF